MHDQLTLMDPMDGDPACCLAGSGDGHMSVAARMFPGCPEQVTAARRWAEALAGAWGAAGADAGLAVSELVTNALQHTRSGQPRGMITVAIAADPGGVTIHVHDLGASNGQVPRLRPTTVDLDGLADSGQGLQIVAAIGVEWGYAPAARCAAEGPDNPVADAGGCCTWCRLALWSHEQGRYGPDPKAVQ